MNILVADDNTVSLKILDSLLKQWGHQITMVQNGQEALNVLKTSRFGLAIINWTLPKMTGLQVCQELSQNKTDVNPYIILSISQRNQKEILLGLQSGASDYLLKPYRKEDLIARIGVGVRTAALQSESRLYTRKIEDLAEYRAQQLVHADRLSTVGMLAAGMAHEINNPLFAISANLSFLQDCLPLSLKSLEIAENFKTSETQKAGFLKKELPAIYQGMDDSIDRIHSIVDGLKLYSRKDSMEKEKISLTQAIEQSITLCQSRLKNVHEVVFQPRPEVMILGNLQRIEQVFVNLLVNAADATALQAHSRIEINLFCQEKQAQILVWDNGPGFNKKILKNIFSPFFTTKEPGKGTGLGLSISQGIIEEHEGSIRAYNHEKCGAVFEILLPSLCKDHSHDTQSVNH